MVTAQTSPSQALRQTGSLRLTLGSSRLNPATPYGLMFRASYLVLIGGLGGPFTIKLLPIVPGEAAEGDPTIWVSATHVGDRMVF